MKPNNMRLAIALSVAVAFGGGYALHDHIGVASAQATTVSKAAPVLLPAALPATLPGAALPDFSGIVDSQGKAVVNISVSGTTKTQALEFPDFGPQSPFKEFFRQFQIPAPNGNMPIHGQGSGFIVDSDGIVLTNAHVVADAEEVMVRLTDKREFKAKVIGVDKQTDVAVLKINANNLPRVTIGDPEKVHVGEWVVAIGSPFGFENSVTAGIVSAKSRTLSGDGYVPFMQTDVAINPGNSGGPLFNVRGEVIGINSQIYSRNGGYQGLSFAIPIDVAMDVEHQLLTKGKVTRGRLGIMIQEVNQALADSFGLDSPRGALVASVEADSAASRAGIQSGDVITKFNGRDIARSSELPALVAGTAPGSKVSIEVWRHGKAKELQMTVGEMKSAVARDKSEDAASPSSSKLGLAVRPLKEDEKANSEESNGLIVEYVKEGPAAKAGIQAGDVILAVNGSRIGSVEQLSEQVAKAGNKIALLVKRGDRTMFVPVKTG
ncbi:MAG: DegQ family serine endoprotease [Betaproteobacteria bacterium]|nr:DegQ family serine endoprotease [Betaproteobacteria bacterium]